MPNTIFIQHELHKVFMNDKCADVVLTDAALIYYGPIAIRKAIKEITRLTRSHIVMIELYSPSFFKRWAVRLLTGYNLHNYKRLLGKAGFYDIEITKIPKEVWPGTPWEFWGFLITAKI